MNYLELAKDYIAKLLEHEDGTVPAELATSATMFVTANALIAIAEQLEKANKMREITISLQPRFALNNDLATLLEEDK